ncbi:MAG: cyclopropane-fatty-acyl-phospholipid synthase family protein [Gammaproteobacteria bacterium]
MRNADVLGLARNHSLHGDRSHAPVTTNENAPTALDRLLARLVLELTNSPAVSVVLWDGSEFLPPRASAAARIVFRNRAALYGMARNPELHFGDAYSTGDIDVEGELRIALENIYRALDDRRRPRWLRAIEWLRSYRGRINTEARARDNIHHHYDINSDFYRLWLDDAAMQYTCAYFPSTAMTLEQAQLAKMNHVARKLLLKPGETVVEAGGGWGGLALHLARRYGVHVRSYNISHEQVRFARECLKQTDLGGKVEYVEDDYRTITGRYDAFVSVGMLEHVGPAHYPQLGKVIQRCLKPQGRGLIHNIGRNSRQQMNAWIERRIFPGAYPPTLSEMSQIFEPFGFSILDVENLRLHYSRTLSCWLSRFDANAEVIRQMHDESFVRAWRLYLTGSLAAFNVGALQLFQVVFTHEENNDLPWSRQHLYRDAA